MQKLLRLCLWQVVFISIVSLHLPVNAKEEQGVRLRGPKSSDVFPYERYGPISARDTLWNIALTVRPDRRLTVYQVMQALFQANPQAFSEGNFNHLVEGQYIQIPSFDMMMAINPVVARQKSNQDEKNWEKKVSKVEKEQEKIPTEPLANKKDLEQAKLEINNKLKSIDVQQQQRLETIQNDVLDSIDGLQAILKENEALRNRLTSFNDQLDDMQSEVARNKEIKLQMDDMIILQQELLEKARAREEELLLEKQQRLLDESGFTSSIWFKVLLGILPVIIVIGGATFFIIRRKKKPSAEEGDIEEKVTKAPKVEEVVEEEPLLADLDDELSLDDDLSIDLLEGDDNDAIHLDEDDDDALDDLGDLDDLDDIVLDGDDSLDSGEVDQSELDSLLSESDSDEDATEESSEEESEEEGEDLGSDGLDQNDLDDLLSGLSDDDEDESSNNNEEIVHIDEALEEDDSVEGISDDLPDEVTDPDDIDALLESMNTESTDNDSSEPEPESESSNDVVDELPAEITDPDDIDALLESMNAESTDNDSSEPEPEPESSNDVVDELPAEITDPDDIDALLESMNVESTDNDSTGNKPEITDESELEVSEDQSAETKFEKEITDESETPENKSSENVAKIESFTEEYVAPFLATDFSDIETKNTETDDELEQESGSSEQLSDSDDDFDIDALINEAQDTKDATKQEEAHTSLEDDIDIEDAISSEFDESVLTHLLNEEEEGDNSLELAPDFSKQSVLADLLTDDDDNKGEIPEASEISDIKELDSLDFDELLANIEDESTIEQNKEPVDFNQDLDVGDEIINEMLKNKVELSDENSQSDKDFVSVDSLLTESMDTFSTEEPYNKNNIDVGLEEYSEFTGNTDNVDVDEEDSVEAKIDLATMYMDIGDNDNAEAILLEVIKEGDEQQKADAKALIDNLF